MAKNPKCSKGIIKSGEEELHLCNWLVCGTYKSWEEAGEVAQRLTALVALPEDSVGL